MLLAALVRANFLTVSSLVIMELVNAQPQVAVQATNALQVLALAVPHQTLAELAVAAHHKNQREQALVPIIILAVLVNVMRQLELALAVIVMLFVLAVIVIVIRLPAVHLMPHIGVIVIAVPAPQRAV